MADSNYYFVENVPLYGQREMGLDSVSAEMACWFACAKMVLDAKKPQAVKIPQKLLTGGQYDLLDLRKILSDMGLTLLNGDPSVPWTAKRLADTLEEWGPLCAYGKFFKGDMETGCFGTQHCIVIIGVAADSLVYFHDPWQPRKDHMGIGWFQRKLCTMNLDSVSGAWVNKKTWKTIE
ncbi:MAG: hypothetical protein M3384_22495 [Acidobacteriota bacterium]|nr:hypothetical protein [Acidobacteriota bacterium]